MRELLALLLLLSIPSSVLARSKHEYAYSFPRVWNAAVRLVRVDLACPISEKDKEDGYFLFEYKHAGQSYSGSVELIRSKVEGNDGVQVVIQIPEMPQYVERMIFTRLTRKLSEEYGSPLQPPKKDKKKPSEDKSRAEKGEESRPSKSDGSNKK